MAKQEIEERLERAEIFMLKVAESLLFGISESNNDYFYDTISELYAELEEDE